MTTLQIKRRHTGAAGAPTTLKPGQLAASDVDGNVYYGAGDNGSGQATSIVAVAGAVKADAAATASALATKANATDVGNALAAKADQAAVTSALAAKADQTAVAAAITAAKAEVKAEIMGAAPAELINDFTEMAAKFTEDGNALSAALAQIATKAPADQTYTKAQVDAAIAASVPSGLDDGTY